MLRMTIVLAAALVGGSTLIGCTRPDSRPQPSIAHAADQSAASASTLMLRGEQIVAVINGKGNPAETFTTAFLSEFPESRLNALAASVRGRLGAPTGIARVEPSDARGGTVFVNFPSREVPIRVTLEAQPPHRIQGMQF